MRKYQKYNGHVLMLIILLIACYIRPAVVTGSQEKTDRECTLGDKECRKTEKPKLRLALPYINTVKVGYEQQVQLSEGKLLNIKTLSTAPPIFEIPDFFTADECDLVIEMAKNKGMSDSPVMEDPRGLPNDTTKQVFDDWDTNDDGFIDPEEVIYLPGKSDLYLTTEDVTKMFADLAIDKDNNGKMDFEELQAVTVEGMKKYFDGLRNTKSRLRSRNTQQTWLWHDEDELLQYEDLLEDYHDRFSKLTKLPSKIIEDSEPLQVEHYQQHGHYHCHHDSEVINTGLPCCTYGASECRLCRYLTVSIFLNDVEDGGELAFPVADNNTFNWEVWTKESLTKCNLAKHCSESNLVIKPKKGKAILFYNHLLNHKTRWLSAVDPRALVGGCDVRKGEKWIANAWININGDGINDLISWKSAANWMSGNNRNDEVITALKRTDTEGNIDEEIENRYTLEKNILRAPTSNKIEGPPRPEGTPDFNNVQGHARGSYDAIEGINMKEVKNDNTPHTQQENIYTRGTHDATQGINMKEVKKDNTPQTQQENIYTRGTHDATQGINMKEVKNDNTPQTQQENVRYTKQSTQEQDEEEEGPTGPIAHLGNTPAPLPLPLETVTEPKPPTMDDPPIPPQEGYRVLRSIMLLIDELDQVELEILARNLHSKLKLVCVPLIMNPMGGI
ncbi:transmembrane prolyl 4-hydroxylase-like [Actinia tenebrosa]|uniref:Transmembrane prolyl 4-hydroxylase-like n=1 Tax=Actinia tenebrosa TaxID=6105 RepID=A0A6P8HIV8_ACTTE|nr:transmembrane prolyl 4-hydroxylase-like [Actinia tenebrosa]